MKIRAVLVCLTLILVVAPRADSQGPGIMGPRPSALYRSPIQQDSAPHYFPMYQTYAREGALYAGIPLGLLVGSLAGGFCRDTDANSNGKNCDAKGIVAGVATAGVAGMIGAFIGSASHRQPLIPDPVVGDHGPAWGLAFAGSGLLLGGIIAHGDCLSDCTGETIKGSLLTAVAGGAIGYAFGTLFPKYSHR